MEKRPFTDFDLSDQMKQAIDALGYELAAPIQSAALPPLLEGRDLVGQSPTGSGKTAAFGIPLVERLDPKLRAVQAMILCPTRELAVQVAGELHKLASFMPELNVLPIFGGASFDRQVQGINRGAQVVIGTPGRVLDHLRRGTLKLDQAKTIVLDEADEMLDMGFREDIETALAQMPEDRQTVLFSATMPKAIRELMKRFTRDPAIVTVSHEHMSAPDIEQIYYEARFRSKPEVLARLLDTHEARLTIVFCNTKRTVDDVTESLVARGFGADRLHGDVTQMVRTRVMNAFRNGSISVLVATDVAARGLDVDDVDLVINYDLPFDAEDYVHRIGRTGRAGRSGKAIALVAGKDIYKLQTIQRHTKQKVERFKVPTLDELEEQRTDRFFSQLRDLLAGGEFPKNTRIIDRLLDQGFSPTDISAATLHLLLKSDTKTAEPIPEDRPKDAPRERRERPERSERPAGSENEKLSNPFDKPESGSQAPRAQEGDRASLFVNIGKVMGVSPGDLAGVLYNAGGFPQGSIGRIQLFEKHSIIDVPRDLLATALENLSEVKVKGKDVRFKEDSGQPGGDGGGYKGRSGGYKGRSDSGGGGGYKGRSESGGGGGGYKGRSESGGGGGGYKGRSESGGGGGGGYKGAASGGGGGYKGSKTGEAGDLPGGAFSKFARPVRKTRSERRDS